MIQSILGTAKQATEANRRTCANCRRRKAGEYEAGRLASGGMPIEEADAIASEAKARIHKLTNYGYCIVHMDPEGSQLPETLHDPATGELTEAIESGPHRRSPGTGAQSDS